MREVTLIDKYELVHTSHRADARMVTHVPLFVDDASEVQLGHGVEDARPTQSHRRHATDSLVFKPIIYKAQVLDGAACGPHLMFDVGALESRPGGAGGASQRTLVQQTDLVLVPISIARVTPCR